MSKSIPFDISGGKIKMANVKQMQGVSSQLEFLKSNDGKRRHKARCIFYLKDGKICDCPHNLNFYNSACGGSSRCKYYEEV